MKNLIIGMVLGFLIIGACFEVGRCSGQHIEVAQ